ncbi:MAG: hypothetical protein JNK04_05900, partial [Myxococcales bacterium]|nr:hypothetical protein [Myxococcales bacterium]
KALAPPTADKKKPAPVWLDLGADGAELVTRDDKRVVCAVGDAVDIRALSYDAGQDRWVLGLDRVRA